MGWDSLSVLGSAEWCIAGPQSSASEFVKLEQSLRQ